MVLWVRSLYPLWGRGGKGVEVVSPSVVRLRQDREFIQSVDENVVTNL